MIRDLVPRFARGDENDPRALQAEIDRLRAQNEKLRGAMRHCIDCEYRIEVLATRADQGLSAAGGPSATNEDEGRD